MLFNVVSLLALGTAVAALPAGDIICPRTKCFDAVNACGVKYGGCYDTCTQQRPPPPPCPVLPTTITETPALPTTITDTPTLPTTITGFPTTITSKATVPTTIVTSVCTSTGTVCADYLKTCGSPPTAVLTYGGCYAACGPEPTFSPPPCPVPSVVGYTA